VTKSKILFYLVLITLNLRDLENLKSYINYLNPYWFIKIGNKIGNYLYKPIDLKMNNSFKENEKRNNKI
jgi:hypothetical protein